MSSSLGQLLETARRAEGLTQEQLARSAGITQAALSRYEAGLRDPDDNTIEALGSALNLLPDFFAQAAKVRGASAVEAHMRRRKTARPSQWRRLEARLNMHRLHARRVFDDVALRADFRVPTFDPFDTNPSHAAAMTRMQWHMPAGPVRNLIGWAEQAGCIVIEEDFGTQSVDGLSQWIDEIPIILVNQLAPTDRKRLTIAHEIAHLCLHSDDVGENPESQANFYAAEFLMPGSFIKPQLRGLRIGKLIDLKREWQVSMQALIERAYELGTVTASQRINLYKSMSANGWRTREPVSDELAQEVPALTLEIGASLTSRGLSRAEIVKLLGYMRSDTAHPYAQAARLRAL